MQFFGRKLFHVPTPLYVCNLPFYALPEDPDLVRSPLDDDAAAGGAYIPSQPVARDLPRFALRGSVLRYVPRHYDRFTIAKTGSFADYVRGWSGHQRRKLGYAVRKLREAAGAADCFRLYRTPDEMLEFHRLAAPVAAKTYQARFYARQLPDTPEFRRELVELAAQDRTLGALLVVRGQPAAFWWLTRHGPVLVSEYTGFDPDRRALSPGTVLLYLLLEQVFADPRITMFDFGEGDAFYKERFATRKQRCAEVFYLRPRARTLSMVALDSSFIGLRHALAPLEQQLEELGIKARLKRMLRG
jgi:CelD/BcsL family acetyltransferase involved in cellulose biosynthesis